MEKKYKVVVNGDGFTHEVAHEYENSAELEAEGICRYGCWVGRRYYPAHKIFFCEIVEVS